MTRVNATSRDAAKTPAVIPPRARMPTLETDRSLGARPENDAVHASDTGRNSVATLSDTPAESRRNEESLINYSPIADGGIRKARFRDPHPVSPSSTATLAGNTLTGP